MGKNNRARRAAKARQRARRGRAERPAPRADDVADLGSWLEVGDGPGAGPFGPFGDAPPRAESQAQRVERVWTRLLMRAEAGADLEGAARALAQEPVEAVERRVESTLLEVLGGLTRSGWQPGELRREMRRSASAPAARLMELMLLVDDARHPGRVVDERWSDQLRGFSMRRVSTQGAWLATWRDREGVSRSRAYEVAGSLLAVAYHLPVLEELIPPPGRRGTSGSAGRPSAPPRTTTNAADPVLERIRKLLAKAESTEFEEEALALSAKAQQLMTRHAIDEARVHERRDDGDVPRMMRVPIDAPYADAKSYLLQVVAGTNRCRAIYSAGVAMSALLGHVGDLRGVELLFTSLLVQAQNALAQAGSEGYGRSQSFRSSFYLAYAHRIEERLGAATEVVLAETSDRESLLPALLAREKAVDDLVAVAFGDSLVSGRVRGGYDPLGADYGRRAADRAELDSGAITR